MLGRTAGGLFWMFRNLERSENTARLIDAGFRIALTRPTSSEWKSVLQTAAAAEAFYATMEPGEQIEQGRVINFLLRDQANPSSVLNCVAEARRNARMVRTALTREVWEAVNDNYIALKKRLARPVPIADLPDVLSLIRQQSAQVRGALHGSMLRNDGFNFARMGTFLERADNTARILDVKYYVLLPSVTQVGSSLDNVQWETILRSVAGERALSWLHQGKITPVAITDFLIFDRRMPRSLRFSVSKIKSNLELLARDYSLRHSCHEMVAHVDAQLTNGSIGQVFDDGLHEFLTEFLERTSRLGHEIETEFRFYG